MYTLLCIVYCTSKTSTWGRAVSGVCVHLATVGVYAVWLDALLSFQFPYEKTRKTKLATDLTVQCVCLFVCVLCICAFILTLDVYLLHLIDLRNSLSELLCKLPELLSARGAKTHQLLLLWGKRAQHGDAMGIVWKCQSERGAAFTIRLILKVESGCSWATFKTFQRRSFYLVGC